VLLDEPKAGGRIPLIIGHSLTELAWEGRPWAWVPQTCFVASSIRKIQARVFTLAQKMMVKACVVEGIRLVGRV
jgi:aconitase B